MKSKGVAIGLVVAVLVGVAVRANTSVDEGAKAQNARKKIDYNRDVRPILSDNCFRCHGFDPANRAAELRLDTKEGLFGVRDDTYPVVPGKPDDSVLYMRITSDDDDYRMPHKKSNKKLTPAQIETLKQWIEQGAEWQPHWAYVPPVRPEVSGPKIDGFTRNAIDHFTAATMAEHDLKPSPEADRRTLIRRLSLDITGLPPTSEEVEEFVNDKEANAYEKLVNRLLASPHYGERMAVMWMDLVRYGDSIGFHSDNPREVWPWRDWLINAFNHNRPFDQMTVEQLAGDLLPNATREQKVASGYNRLLLTTGEGGAQAKEYITKYASDRVRNVSSVWMGATLGCAQCHDHKFDPYKAKDFYQMAAFFADIQEPAIAVPTPELLLPDQEQEEELNRLDGAIASAKAKLASDTPELAAAQAEFEKDYLKDKNLVKWEKLTVTEATSTGGAMLVIGKDKWSVLASGNSTAIDTYVVRGTTKLKGITGLRIDAVPHGSLPGNGPGRYVTGNFVLTELDVHTEKGNGPTTKPIAFLAASASFEQTSGGETSHYGKWPAIAAIDGDKFSDKWGWAVFGQTGKQNHAVFETATDIGNGEAEVHFKLQLHQKFGGENTLGHFRVSVTNSPRPIKAASDKGIPADIAKILDTEAEKRTKEQKDALTAHYRSVTPLLEPVRQELAKLNAAREELTGPGRTKKYNNKPGRIPRTLISVAGMPRETRVLPRGNWLDETGEVVQPAVPHFMRQIDKPADQRATRLDLGRWLVARDNPLTARVFVNRLWKMYYGQGIAKPLDDLGAQSEWPTHPELLDYLAVEFMDSGWDIKHIVRLMVLSGTYRQSSNSPKELREKDPYNKYVARQGAFRLDAEFVRDNALRIAGVLSPRMFGPSVKPYQPEGYWDFLNFPKRKYDQDHGESLYRRGVYTWWQRTFLNPSLLAFDAPSHEECTAERTRSNTPQQALTLLNDTTYVEAARVFAERIVKSGGKDPTERIKWAYRRALAREPLSQEIPVLLALYEKQYKRYAADQESAKKIITAGEYAPPKADDPCELAAWTSVARAILNLHETITRN